MLVLLKGLFGVSSMLRSDVAYALRLEKDPTQESTGCTEVSDWETIQDHIRDWITAPSHSLYLVLVT
jgi:hypothetical protein